ncbi:hypothetical protein [Streptomyces sp. ODS28]|uniref:hypothetical protein n=1 Tax=Streptomyces sp. ODS28 TaxID=3136688 RepID=UPI0031E8959E
MTSYATAIKTHAEREPTFGESNYIHGFFDAGDVHAVVWPDPWGRTWEEAETVCGRPTRGMEQYIHPNPAQWPQPRFQLDACDACDRGVQAATGG